MHGHRPRSRGSSGERTSVARSSALTRTRLLRGGRRQLGKAGRTQRGSRRIGGRADRALTPGPYLEGKQDNELPS
jgi:hypothetical protein